MLTQKTLRLTVYFLLILFQQVTIELRDWGSCIATESIKNYDKQMVIYLMYTFHV